MIKKDYVERISVELKMTKKNVNLVIDELFKLMSDDLKAGEKIVITNFGTFNISQTKPFDVYSPHDGKLIKGISQKRIHFKSSEFLKDKIK